MMQIKLTSNARRITYFFFKDKNVLNSLKLVHLKYAAVMKCKELYPLTWCAGLQF